MLLDVAPGNADRQLTRMVNDARRGGKLYTGQLRDLVDHCPRQPGARHLRPFVERPRHPTRSEFEDRFVAFEDEYGLPEPTVNARCNGHEVDALFPVQRLIVELDGWDFHNDRNAFETDPSAMPTRWKRGSRRCG